MRLDIRCPVCGAVAEAATAPASLSGDVYPQRTIVVSLTCPNGHLPNHRRPEPTRR